MAIQSKQIPKFQFSLSLTDLDPTVVDFFTSAVLGGVVWDAVKHSAREAWKRAKGERQLSFNDALAAAAVAIDNSLAANSLSPDGYGDLKKVNGRQLKNGGWKFTFESEGSWAEVQVDPSGDIIEVVFEDWR
jgi:hypothetical protein